MAKINWKHLSSTAGYKSLKAAYIRDVSKAARQKHPMRKKDVFLKLFQWVIGRAIHYAHHTGKSVEQILNEWEKERNYWWFGFYEDNTQPKFHSNSLKPKGLRYFRKHYSKEYIRTVNKDESTKAKPRWTTARKKRGYRICKSVT